MAFAALNKAYRDQSTRIAAGIGMAALQREKEAFQYVYRAWQADWNLFAKDCLRVNLDPKQQAILSDIQHHRHVTVKSGHGRGKDYVAAVAAVCFFNLMTPCKVLLTGPTMSQARDIMMAEVKRLASNSLLPFGGRLMDTRIENDKVATHFLKAFKPRDNDTTSWTGLHSNYVLIIFTEASELDESNYNAMEGNLTGVDSRLVLIGNPTITSGPFFSSHKSPQFKKHTLSSMDAPNVLAKKIIIPGQVDWQWINERVGEPGWTRQIHASEANPEDGDFQWKKGNETHWFRPSDLFRIKVLGLWPNQPEGTLIPLSWLEASRRRWKTYMEEGGKLPPAKLRLGADVAGQGADLTCFCRRYGILVDSFSLFGQQEHTVTAGRLKKEFTQLGDSVFVDAVGEGAGVVSMLKESTDPDEYNVVAFKSNFSADSLKDLTRQLEFYSLRDYVYWAIRDALNPDMVLRGGGNLMLPPDDALDQELSETKYAYRSDGRIEIEPKKDIKKRLGRSPDRADALAMTYAPITTGAVIKVLGNVR